MHSLSLTHTHRHAPVGSYIHKLTIESAGGCRAAEAAVLRDGQPCTDGPNLHIFNTTSFCLQQPWCHCSESAEIPQLSVPVSWTWLTLFGKKTKNPVVVMNVILYSYQSEEH